MNIVFCISVNNKTLVYDGKTLDFNNADAKFVDANICFYWKDLVSYLILFVPFVVVC